jgi:predicted nucleotidyltransferase
MKASDKGIIDELRRRLSSDVQRHVKQLLLYGSRARGDADDDSDLDLIALVDEKTPALEQVLEDAAYDVMWDYDFKPIISLKVFAEARFRSSVQKGFSFYRNVEQEGIAV